MTLGQGMEDNVNQGISWNHASIQEDDHQNNRLEQNTEKVEILGKRGLRVINEGQQKTQTYK